MQLRFARTHRDAEHVRNFLVTVTVDRLQHDDVTRALRQGRERALDVHHFGRIDLAGPAARIVDRLRDRLIVRFAARPMIARIRQHLVHGDAMQPRAKSAAPFECGEVAPRTYERELCAVLRHVMAPRHAQTQSEYPSAMHAIQALERAHISAARSLHQRRIRKMRAVDRACESWVRTLENKLGALLNYV